MSNFQSSLKGLQITCERFLTQFGQERFKCECGELGSIMHYVDDDPTNLLPSNIDLLCIKCEEKVTRQSASDPLPPFVSISKLLTFASAHRLPNHDGKCKNWHGHEWKVEVTVRKRINPETGMVVDFSKLKGSMKDSIITPLDHDIINKYLDDPTAENLLLWCWEKLIFDGLKGIERITLWESPDSMAVLDSKSLNEALALGKRIKEGGK